MIELILSVPVHHSSRHHQPFCKYIWSSSSFPNIKSIAKEGVLKCTYLSGLATPPVKTGGDVCIYRYRYRVVVNDELVDVFTSCLKFFLFVSNYYFMLYDEY